MAEQYSEKDVKRFAAFLDQVKRDLQADGVDSMLCFAAAVGLMRREKPADVLPPINPTHEGKLAVIPCFHGEAEKLPGMLAMLLDPEAGDISRGFPPNSLKNIMFRYRTAKGVKSNYKSVGDRDPYNSDCYEILEKLKTRFPSDVIVDMGFMDCRPFIEEKVVEAVNNGASRVIVAHTMITVSGHTEEIEERVEGLGLEKKGIELAFTEPLWNDEKFIQHKANRILEIVGDEDKSKVGVAILGYGVPQIPSPGRYETYNLETNTRYTQALIKKLEENGIKNTAAGYLRWLKPNISDCAKTLAEKGARLIVFDWFHAARNLHSLVDIPAHFEMLEMELPEGTKLVMVGPEKDSPGFIDVLVNQIEKAKKKFEK
jgi:protoheme ferro-lyase